MLLAVYDVVGVAPFAVDPKGLFLFPPTRPFAYDGQGTSQALVTHTSNTYSSHRLSCVW